jgi:hypothetical protein
MSRKIILEDNFTEENDNWVAFNGRYTGIDYENGYAKMAWEGYMQSKEFDCEGLDDVTITYNMVSNSYGTIDAIQWWTGSEWKQVLEIYRSKDSYIGQFKITDPTWLSKNNKIIIFFDSPDSMYKLKLYSLKIDAKSSDRYIFSDNNEFKTFDLTNKMWIDVSSSNETKLKGITSLRNLIQNTKKTIKPQVKTDLETGKKFSEPVNLKAFKTISNISIF